MEYSVSLPRPELIQMADIVARDKGIDKESVLIAMEDAIAKAGRSKYGVEHDVRAHIDRKNGEIKLARYIEVVNDGEVENEITQLPLSLAVKKKPDVQVGEFLIDPLPPIDFGRIAAGTAKQVIMQKVREAERTRQYEEYKDKVGEMINGTVKRMEIGNVIVDLGKAEAIVRRDELIPRETFRTGDRIRAYIMDVRQEIRGPQIFLSRTCPEFMAKLFTQEVPEIYDGIIEIKGVARDPGSRAKMSVISKDPSIDPVGACVGMRGARVQAVVSELQGEKIDIIEFSNDSAAYIVNALAPAEVTKVIMDSDNNHIEVVVPENQLSLAIGRKGQNVRLASQLTGWHIDIVTEAEEAESRQKAIKQRSQMFIDALDVEDVIAHLLVEEGFQSLEDVAYVPLDDLSEIEGFDEELAAELQSRAVRFLERKQAEAATKYQELGLDESLTSFEGIDSDVLVKLGEAGVKTLDDLADLATDELMEIAGEGVYKRSEANDIIMKAREHWFEDEKAETGDTNG